MKHWLSLALLLTLPALNSVADGLIIVHDPVPLPHPIPPLHPAPRPPHFLPPPRHAFAPLEVTFHRVEVRIKDQVAVTSVDQEFYNPNDRQLEGTYLFPIPKGAQIDKFSMEIGGKQVQAELLAADKARKIYEDIVRSLKDPALLEYAGRDVFKVRIFPIEPRSKKRVRLSYTEVLRQDAGLVSYLYPLNTEKFSAKPLETVSLRLEIETRRPLKSIYSPSHNVEIQRHGGSRATIGFEAKDVKPDTDFQLYFAPEGGDVGLNLITYRTGSEDGYFLLLAAPGLEVAEAKAMPKDVAFVLDTSGSMAGKKLEQAKKALAFCVENLNDSDRFEIIRFATETEPLFDRLSEANRANRNRAQEFIAGLKPIGGTAIYDALQRALSVRADKSDRPFLVIFITDGLPTVGETDPDRILTAASRSGANTRVFCFGIGNDVNTHLLDRITEATRATSAYVLPEEDIEVKVSGFFAKIKDPVLAQVRLQFPESVHAGRLHPTSMPDLFRGEQLVAVGRYSGSGSGKITLEGKINGSARTFTYDAKFPAEAAENDFIPRLWATRRIGFLLDEIRLRGESSELRDEVAELARRYGIVTPYTAFLIHEDEARRQVPIAAQSMPALGNDREALALTRDAYHDLATKSSGGSAVAAARYGLAQQSANQPAEALRAGRLEANRALTFAAGAPPALATVPVKAQPGVSPGPVAPAAMPTRSVSDQVVEYTQQSRYVGGRNFFLNGTQWVDAGVQKLQQAKKVRVQFSSPEYFDLIAKQPEARPWLALGQNLQFVLGGTVYEVFE